MSFDRLPSFISLDGPAKKNDKPVVLGSHKVRVADVGTGDITWRTFELFTMMQEELFDEPEKVVCYSGGKVKMARKNGDGTEVPNESIVQQLKDALTQDDIVTIINLTSFARNNPTGSNLDLIRMLQRLADLYPQRIILNILTQPEEAKLTGLAMRYAVKYMDLPPDVTDETVLVWDSGRGSVQCDPACPDQAVEIGANEIEKQFKKGPTLNKITHTFKKQLLKDLQEPQLVEGKKHIIMTGLGGLGLNDKNVKAELGINDQNEGEWKRGKIQRPLNAVIKALEKTIEKSDKKVNDLCIKALKDQQIVTLLSEAKRSSSRERKDDEPKRSSLKEKKTDKTPNAQTVRNYVANIMTQKDSESERICEQHFKDIAASIEELKKVTTAIGALSMLQAHREKYGGSWKVMPMTEDVELYNPQRGTPLGKQLKINVSSGAAIQYLLRPLSDLTPYGKIDEPVRFYSATTSKNRHETKGKN